jgi:hypothetical protein
VHQLRGATRGGCGIGHLQADGGDVHAGHAEPADENRRADHADRRTDRPGRRRLDHRQQHAGNGDTGLAALLAAGRIHRVICSFPRQLDSYVFDGLFRAGKVDLEVVPQGNLAERMRAAGAGIGAFFCPTGVGTPLAEGKERRTIDGRDYVLEYPIRGNVALIGAHMVIGPETSCIARPLATSVR